MERYSLEIFADYRTIYAQDEDSDSDLSGLISNKSLKTRLIYTPEQIIIFTARNMSVPLTIEKVESEPNIDLDPRDHVIECSINLSSGSLLIAGGTDYFPDATRISVQPGIYKMRIFYGGLNTISKDGLDGNNNYRIIFLPTEQLSDIAVLKSCV